MTDRSSSLSNWENLRASAVAGLFELRSGVSLSLGKPGKLPVLRIAARMFFAACSVLSAISPFLEVSE